MTRRSPTQRIIERLPTTGGPTWAWSIEGDYVENLPWPRVSRYGVAVVLLVLGLGVALMPGDVPGFSEPQDDQGEMHMKMMR